MTHSLCPIVPPRMMQVEWLMGHGFKPNITVVIPGKSGGYRVENGAIMAS